MRRIGWNCSKKQNILVLKNSVNRIHVILFKVALRRDSKEDVSFPASAVVEPGGGKSAK